RDHHGDHRELQALCDTRADRRVREERALRISTGCAVPPLERETLDRRRRTARAERDRDRDRDRNERPGEVEPREGPEHVRLPPGVLDPADRSALDRRGCRTHLASSSFLVLWR